MKEKVNVYYAGVTTPTNTLFCLQTLPLVVEYPVQYNYVWGTEVPWPLPNNIIQPFEIRYRKKEVERYYTINDVFHPYEK